MINVLFQNRDFLRRKAYFYRMLNGSKELNEYYGSKNFEELNEEVEEKIAEYLKVDYSVLTSSGLSALKNLLDLLPIKKDQKLYLQAYTCKQLAQISAKKIKPELIDIDETFNANLTKLSKAEKGNYFLAINSYGKPLNMKQVMEISERKKLTVIEDIAHAFGAKIGNKKLGSFTGLGIASLRKNMACGIGGAIITNNKQIYSNAKKKTLKLKHKSKKDFLGIASLYLKKKFRKMNYPYILYSKSIPLNENENILPTRLSLCIILNQIKKIDSVIEKNQENAKYLINKLKKEKVETPKISKGEKHAFTRFLITFKKNKSEEIVKEFNEKRFDVGLFYKKDFELNVNFTGKNEKNYPKSLEVANQSVPVSVIGLNKKDLNEIIELTKKHS